MLVYDVTHEKSFDNIRNWIRNIEEVCVCITMLVQIANLKCKFQSTVDRVFVKATKVFIHSACMYRTLLQMLRR